MTSFTVHDVVPVIQSQAIRVRLIHTEGEGHAVWFRSQEAIASPGMKCRANVETETYKAGCHLRKHEHTPGNGNTNILKEYLTKKKRPKGPDINLIEHLCHWSEL